MNCERSLVQLFYERVEDFIDLEMSLLANIFTRVDQQFTNDVAIQFETLPFFELARFDPLNSQITYFL